MTELNNTAFNATENGYDLAVLGYQAVAGCVLGQAGKKGAVLDSMHSLIPGWNNAIKDDVTESAAYMVGHVACAIVFPEIALARDFSVPFFLQSYRLSLRRPRHLKRSRKRYGNPGP